MTFNNVVGAMLAMTLAALTGSKCEAQTIRSPSGGAVSALLIGIDEYDRYQRLQGAVSDAKDIETALLRAGVDRNRLQVLTDRAASRVAVVRAFRRLVQEAKPGEAVVIAFAGHGAQMRERVKGSEPDGMTEIFVLPAYSKEAPGNAERLEDKEIHLWLKELNDKNVTVIMIADTCHGGGLARAPVAFSGDLTWRHAGDVAVEGRDTFRSIYDEPEPNRPVVSLKDLQVTIPSLKQVSFIAAVDKRSKSPEVPIPGQATRRGAVSYAFAREIDRLLDSSSGAVLTRRALFDNTRQIVDQYAKSQQRPQTEPAEETTIDAVVLRNSGGTGAPVEETHAAAPPCRIRVAATNGDKDELSKLVGPSVKIEITDGNADLVWDQAAREVRGHGDVIAKNVRPNQIAGIIDRTCAIRELERMSERRLQQFAMPGYDGRRLSPRDNGTAAVLRLAAPGSAGRHLAIVNIASTGQVQIVYPPAGQTARPEAKDWSAPLKITEPFGVDTVFAITAAEPLTSLVAWLERNDQRIAAGELASEIRKQAERIPSTKIGSVSLVTEP